MTLAEKRKQLLTLFGAYSIRLEKLYDDFLRKLSKLAIKSKVSVKDMLKKDALYNFDNYPELREELKEIMSSFFKSGILEIKSAIASGAALSYSQYNQEFKGYSIIEEKSLYMVRQAAAQAFYENRMKPEQGLGLSSMVWNYVRQAKSEVEAGISTVMTDGLSAGTSAEDLARKVKVYLNEPDMMWRRYHEKVMVNGQKKDVAYWRKKVVDENGKVRFIKTVPYHPGQGVYMSARKNALRMTRTEINGSYHYANHQRWMQEPFVIGIRIWMSPEHPKEDVCDILAGDYPKDFYFMGWHPQCMDTATPITIQGEEKKEFYRRLTAGEDMSGYISPNRVTDVPPQYEKWLKDERENIQKAAKRNKLAWHLLYNQKYWVKEFSNEELKGMGLEPPKPKKRIKTEEEKADIQKRWDERKAKNALIIKTGKNIWAVADNLEYAETVQLKASLRDAILKGDLKAVKNYTKSLAKKIAAINKEAKAIESTIPDVKEWLKQFSINELKAAADAINIGLGKLSGKTLVEQKKMLEKEIKYVEDPTFLKPHTQYPTWKVVQDAYAEKLKDVIYQEKLEIIQKQMAVVEQWSMQYPKFRKLAGLVVDYHIAVYNKKDINSIQAAATAAYAEYQKKLIYKARQDAKKMSKNALIEFDDDTRTQERKDAAKWFLDDDSANDFCFDETNTREQWKVASAEEKKALYQYTAGSSYITESLRAIAGHYHFYTSRKDECAQDVDAMTAIISRTYCTHDVWIKRDEGTWCSEYRWGIPDISAYESDPSALVGKIGVDESFMSCGSNKSAYFGSKPVLLNIYCPTGTRMIYAEPFSAFGQKHDSGKNAPGKNWDGDSKPLTMGENEIIVQRGTKMRITKAEYTNGKWYIDCEILSQFTRPIDGYIVESSGFYCKFK